MKSFGNIHEDNTGEWLKSGACELGYQHMTDMDFFNAVAKQK
jgi:hypothetical protein